MCDRCTIGKIYPKTLGEGCTNNVLIFFVCQKPHLFSESWISSDVHKALWKKHGQGAYFSSNLRFYSLLNQAGLLGKQKETQQKLDEISQISLKAEPEKWWTIRKAVCRELLKANRIYLSEAVKCPTPNNRRPKVSEVRACFRWLLQEIKLLNPKVICCLGKDAVKSLFGTKIELEWGQLYRVLGRRIFVSYFPGQYSKVRDETRVKHFRKLRRLI